jgi:hypothetical protein
LLSRSFLSNHAVQPVHFARHVRRQTILSDAHAHSITLGTAHQAAIDHLEAETLSLEQSTVQSVQAETVVAHLSPIGRAQTEHVDAQASAIGMAQSQDIHLRGGILGMGQAAQATISRSVAGVVQANQAQLDDGAIIGVLLAGRVDGNVRPILDLRGVLVLGLVIGLVLKLARPNAKKTP